MRRNWLGLGLFLATLASLLLETLDARLLSVITWYHLSFFAVSLAMLGVAAGAVFVFLDPDRFGPARAPRSLAVVTFAFACSIPISHVVNLCLPFLPLTSFSVNEVVSIAVATVVLAVPFFLSGIAITSALTRCGGAIGRLYACDLLGAAAGCALVVPVLEWTNITSAVFVAAAAASAAAGCFYRFAGSRGARRSGILSAMLLALAAVNTSTTTRLDVMYPKNRQLWLNTAADVTRWNSHSYVIIQKPNTEPSFFWGGGANVQRYTSEIAWLAIDGEAGTPITKWDGNPASLEWVSHDVTTLPYALRGDGDVAIIGVGGGRDVLSAIWGKSRSITGIEVNQIIIDALERSHRAFAGLADRPEVRLVHDDGRAYLTRTPDRFDVIQMSLVDTWAATGAGAFTLSENGLYTVEAWRMFLDRLKPGGVLSVSRWFDPGNLSETSRLLALAVSSLLGRGVDTPIAHVILVVRGRVATLLVSNTPFREVDRDVVERISKSNEFDVVVSPWIGGGARRGRLDRIARSKSAADLRRATDDPSFDFSPPTDARPYYFNMLKPSAFIEALNVPKGGILWGNLRATVTLLVLLAVATLLVGAIIVWPLVRAERPAVAGTRFATTMAYFGIIGFAYMLIQIAFLQRFSVYLGHPTYTLAIVLFSMLLFTGIGSLASERLRGDRRSGFWWIPVVLFLGLLLTAFFLPIVLNGTVTRGLAARSAVVLLFTGPLSVLLGCCFPVGARLVRETPTLLAWAWGINGAFGVLASILAVAVSMWIGIDANLAAAAVLYLALVPLLLRMTRWLNQTVTVGFQEPVPTASRESLADG